MLPEVKSGTGNSSSQKSIAKSLTKYSRLIGLLLLAFLLLKIDLRATFATLLSVNVWPLVVAIVANVPQLGLKALRWRFLLSLQGVSYRPLRAMLAYFSSVYMGLFTPGRVGEFDKAVYLQQDTALSLGEAMSSVFVDRLFDLYALIAAGCYGLLVFASLVEFPVWGILLVLVGLIASILIVYQPFGHRVSRMILRLPLLKRSFPSLLEQVDSFYAKLKLLFQPKLLVAIAITLVAHLIFYIQCYLIVLALGLPLQFRFILFAMALVNLVNLLPVSISGLGTREAILSLLFAEVQLPSEMAVAYAALVIVVFYVAAGLLGAAAWSAAPLRFTGKVREISGDGSD